MAGEKLTSSSDERAITSVLSADVIYAIPYFQRPYKWKPAKVEQFQNDLLALADSEDSLHFMGAVIIHRKQTNPADTSIFELIDGQQRITTIYIHVAAAVDVLIQHGMETEAVTYFRKFLINHNEQHGKPNSVLQPSATDRHALNVILEKLSANPVIEAKLPGFSYTPVHPAPVQTSKISKNTERARRFFRDQAVEGGPERVKFLLDTMLGRMTVVFIEVKDPLDGPRIFDSLNSAQEPMTVGDLVRNDIFARSTTAAMLDQLETVNTLHWEPFVKKFGKPELRYFDDYFFPYGLTQDPTAKKSEVYTMLRQRWTNAGLSAVDVIKQLSEYQPDYLDLRMGTNAAEHRAEVARVYRKFWESNAAAAAYPFLMQISRSLRLKELPEKTALELFAAVDSFLTRRAVCGIEPTGLHAVFKKLWEGPESASIEHMQQVIGAKHRTVEWPSDDKVAESVRTRSLYGSRITPYLLREHNLSLGGDLPHEGPMWIEHVLPQNPSAGAWKAFAKDDRSKYLHTFANLLPCSAEMNAGLQNGEYLLKRDVYLEDATYKATRTFAKAYDDWNPEALRQRADSLAAWVLERWPIGAGEPE